MVMGKLETQRAEDFLIMLSLSWVASMGSILAGLLAIWQATHAIALTFLFAAIASLLGGAVFLVVMLGLAILANTIWG
jgi:hypothetical protein